MQIDSTRRTQTLVTPKLAVPIPKQDSVFAQDSFEPGWVSAGLSVAGGVISVAGALTNEPYVTVGGMFLTAAATGATALRVQKNGGTMDRAALVSVAGGGGLLVAGALLLAQPQPAAVPNGPLPQLLRKLGVQAFR